ncbi:MAG: 2-amino-4-hydroxy-6-hydroxymethyldihydropteridine diphosphokinase [Calditrichaceae bacterium]
MKYILSLGANTGSREQSLDKAVNKLHQFGRIEKRSGIYKTEPVGIKNQADFLNIICLFETGLGPFRLLRKLKSIETASGRVRTQRWGSRVIDIDIIDWDGGRICTPILEIPHQQMELRKFVLLPLREILPDYKNRSQLTIKQLIENCPDRSEIRAYKDQW